MKQAALVDRLRDRDARVAVIGQGYVGLLLAMRASEAGFAITGIESDQARVAALVEGRSYVDDVPDEVLEAALHRGYTVLHASAEMPRFDVAVIAVPTPLLDGRPDLRAIEEAAVWVGAVLGPGNLVILESTTYPGTTRELLVPVLEAKSGLSCGHDFFVGYSPERIDPGNREYTLASTPKVIAGIGTGALAAMAEFYGAFVDELVPLDRPEEAELTKLLENTFRHVNIALVNELAVFANDLGVNLWAAIDAAATKPFGFMPFRPGPGVGGHCLPVDPSYLSWHVERKTGAPFRFVGLANEVNARMPTYVVQRVQAQLNRDGLALNGVQILVLGLAYKPGTADTREAPSGPIIASLRNLGARVLVADPHVAADPVRTGTELVEFTADVVRAADLVLVLTDHPEFDVALVSREAARVFDTRHCIPAGSNARVEWL